jgi:integrase
VALRELGRIERRLFILDWLQSVELRRRVNTGLNKGEARNALARAVFFYRLGETRDRSFEQQQYRANGLTLATAAIALWNTVYLERATNALCEKGIPWARRSGSTCLRSAGSTSTLPVTTSGEALQDSAKANSGLYVCLNVRSGPFSEGTPFWSVVEASAKDIGIEHFGAHDLRRTCAKLCRKNGGDLEQIKFLLGHSSIQTTERYLGSEQDIVIAVNDNLGV